MKAIAAAEALAHGAYPGAVPPERRRLVDSFGLSISVAEWGSETAPVLLLAHGGSDFARTFDGFAPLLAAGGWRVVSWDHRGHGDSEHAALYNWPADLRDALAVLNSTTDEAVALVGHSKGAGLLLDLCLLLPERFSHFVNMDGLGSARTRRRRPDLTQDDRVQGRSAILVKWLDHRRQAATGVRRPGTLEELAARRGKMNPRLPPDWLRYLVTAGARRDPDGWRWKLDPGMRWGVGPFRPDWTLDRLNEVRVPMLALVSTIEEPMGWGASAEELRTYLSGSSKVEELELGHFLHIEEPRAITDLVLDHLS